MKSPQRMSMGGLRAAQQLPMGELVVIGQAPLMGALTGFLAVELAPSASAAGSKLWTLYDWEQPSFPWNRVPSQLLPYSRLCADAPAGAPVFGELVYWIDPTDALTQAAGIGSEWLTPIPTTPRCGLVPARLNEMMLGARELDLLKVSRACT